jgi:hypothetical protein
MKLIHENALKEKGYNILSYCNFVSDSKIIYAYLCELNGIFSINIFDNIKPNFIHLVLNNLGRNIDDVVDSYILNFHTDIYYSCLIDKKRWFIDNSIYHIETILLKYKQYFILNII